LATSQTWSSAAAPAMSRIASISIPSTAAMAPSPTGTAFCIASDVPAVSVGTPADVDAFVAELNS
jgi:hypothetical protein